MCGDQEVGSTRDKVLHRAELEVVHRQMKRGHPIEALLIDIDSKVLDEELQRQQMAVPRSVVDSCEVAVVACMHVFDTIEVTTNLHSCVRASERACVRACVCACVCVRMCACVRAYGWVRA